MTVWRQHNRWGVAARVILFMLACAVVLAATSPIATNLAGKWREFITGTVAGLGAFALTVLFVRWERVRLQDVGAAAGPRSLARLAFGFLVGLFLVVVWAAISRAAGHVTWVRSPGTGFGSIATALIAYIALAWREELSFHGYPLRTLQRSFGLLSAQLFVAVVFAAEHRLGGSPWTTALLGSGVGSLLFGMAAIATEGLAVPIGLHAAWNFGQWTLGLKGAPGLWKPIDEGAHGSSMIAYVAVMSSATIAFWSWHRWRAGILPEVGGRLARRPEDRASGR